MSKETADLLRKAKERIGTPGRWGKYEYFLDHPSQDLSDFKEFPNDCAACIYGASAWATGDPEITATEEALERALSPRWGSLSSFNDDPNTNHGDVMALFDRAITHEEDNP
jgi:hypothetical protein